MGYKVKKIMLGTQQVRPSGWELSTDFTQLSSWNDVANAGWNGYYAHNGGSFHIGNNGIYNTGGYKLYVYGELPTINSNSKITINIKGNFPSNLSSGVFEMYCSEGQYRSANIIQAGNNASTTGASNSGNYQYLLTSFVTLYNSSSSFYKGDLDNTIIIDFKNGTASYKRNSPWNDNYSGSIPSDMQNLYSKIKYFGFCVGSYNSSDVCYLKSYSIKVE